MFPKFFDGAEGSRLDEIGLNKIGAKNPRQTAGI